MPINPVQLYSKDWKRWCECFNFFFFVMISLKVKLLSRVQLFAVSWTVAYQASPSMEFSRQGYWSGLPFPSPGDLPDPGIEPCLPHCRQMLYHLSQDFGTNLRICLLVPAVLSVSLRNCPAISIQLDHSEFWLLSCPFCKIAGLCLSSSSLCCDLEILPPRRKPGWW